MQLISKSTHDSILEYIWYAQLDLYYVMFIDGFNIM